MEEVPGLGNESFGSLLRRLRLARGLTQEELAERAGLSARGISDLERGLRLHPLQETFERLAAALDLPGEDRARPVAARRASRPTRPLRASSPPGLEPSGSPDRPSRSPSSGDRAASPLHPCICPVLIGREREAEQLHVALKVVAAGGHGIVFLIGDPGIGKSRLLSEMRPARSSFGVHSST